MRKRMSLTLRTMSASLTILNSVGASKASEIFFKAVSWGRKLRKSQRAAAAAVQQRRRGRIAAARGSSIYCGARARAVRRWRRCFRDHEWATFNFLRNTFLYTYMFTSLLPKIHNYIEINHCVSRTATNRTIICHKMFFIVSLVI